MDFNKLINKAVDELTFEQNIQFALSGINRVKPLTKLFLCSDLNGLKYLENFISIEEMETGINDIINYITNYPENIGQNNIYENITFLKKLLLDDEIEAATEKQIFFWYVIIIIHILEYILHKNCKSIYWCSNAIIEIINQTKYDECKNNNSQWTDGEIVKYVDNEIDKEIGKEIEIIKIIKTGNKKLLEEYVINNMLEYKI
jgi:hypothetical protein